MTNRSNEMRPEIAAITSGAELKRWYWLKDELAAEAKRIRNESPEQLDHTISELEQGINPDDRATEGLPH